MPNFEPHHLPEGYILDGTYKILRVLGQGGFGITYKCWDNSLDYPVAIKEFYPHSLVNDRDTSQDHISTRYTLRPKKATTESGSHYKHHKQQFLEEARRLKQFEKNQYIATVTRIFEANNTAYMVMTYYRGPNLLVWLAQYKRANPKDAYFCVMHPILGAVNALHRKGFIHRDIKPANILLRQSTAAINSPERLENYRPILLDFGNARAANYTPGDKSGIVLTGKYAPPEQYSKETKQGPYTDIYACGAVLYNLIEGHPPPDAMGERLRDNMPLTFQYCPPPLQIIISKATALQHTQRYQAVQPFLRDCSDFFMKSKGNSSLTDLGTNSTPPPPPSPSPSKQESPPPSKQESSPPSKQKSKPKTMLLILVFLLGIPVASAMAWNRHQGEQLRTALTSISGAMTTAVTYRDDSMRALDVIERQKGAVNDTFISEQLSELESETTSKLTDITERMEEMESLQTDARQLRGFFRGRDAQALSQRVMLTLREVADLKEEAKALSETALEMSRPLTSTEELRRRLQEGGTIVLGPTTFTLDTHLQLRQNVRLIAKQPSSTIIESAQGGVFSTEHNFTAENVTFRYVGEDPANVLTIGGGEINLYNSIVQGGKYSNSGNVRSTGSGLYVTGRTTGSLESNTFQNNEGSGIVIAGSSKLQISSNRIHSNEQVGILYLDTAEGKLLENDIYMNGRSGILLANRASPEIRNNEIYDNEESGVGYLSSSAGIISNNRIRDNKYDGIVLDHEAHPTIMQNTISNNEQWGIRFQGGQPHPRIDSNSNDIRGNVNGAFSERVEVVFARELKVRSEADCDFRADNVIGTISRNASPLFVMEQRECSDDFQPFLIYRIVTTGESDEGFISGWVSGNFSSPTYSAGSNQPSLEQQITRLHSLGTSGVNSLRLPPGIYSLDRTLTLEGDITIEGSGKTRTVILGKFGDGNIISHSNGRLTLRHLTIGRDVSASQQGQSNENSILYGENTSLNAHNIRVSGVHRTQDGFGIRLLHGSSSISNSLIRLLSNDAIDLSGSASLRVSSTWFSANARASVATHGTQSRAILAGNPLGNRFENNSTSEVTSDLFQGDSSTIIIEGPQDVNQPVCRNVQSRYCK